MPGGRVVIPRNNAQRGKASAHGKLRCVRHPAWIRRGRTVRGRLTATSSPRTPCSGSGQHGFRAPRGAQAGADRGDPEQHHRPSGGFGNHANGAGRKVVEGCPVFVRAPTLGVRDGARDRIVERTALNESAQWTRTLSDGVPAGVAIESRMAPAALVSTIVSPAP